MADAVAQSSQWWRSHHPIGIGMAGEPVQPRDIIKMPIFSDLENSFMLAAQPETRLNDKGNKYRPAGLTQSKSFNRYIELSRRFKQDQKAWQDIVGSKLNLPVCNYDEEKIAETSEAGLSRSCRKC